MPEQYIPHENPVHTDTTLEVTDTTLSNGDNAQVFHWQDNLSQQMMIVPEYGEVQVFTNEGGGWHQHDPVPEVQK